MLHPVLNFLAAQRVVLLHALLHLDLHIKDVIVVGGAELLLDGLDLGEEYAVLVQRGHLKMILDVLWPLFGKVSTCTEQNRTFVSLN